MAALGSTSTQLDYAKADNLHPVSRRTEDGTALDMNVQPD